MSPNKGMKIILRLKKRRWLKPPKLWISEHQYPQLLSDLNVFRKPGDN